jgi:zinc protease
MKAHNHRISLTNVGWFFTAPNQRSKYKKFFYPLTILAHILAGNEVSRLYIALVEDKKLAVNVSISYLAPALLDPWPLGVSATLAPKASLVELKQALAQELDKLIKDGVSEQELADAKRDLLTAVVMDQDSALSMIQYFIPLATGMTLEDIEAYPENIAKVTREQVHEAVKFVFSKQPILKTMVYPSPQD